MFKKIFNRKNNNVTATVATKKVSLNNGDVLRLVMANGERREVTVMAAHKESMKVKELFHGIYELPYNEIMLAYQGNDLFTFVDIKKSAQARVA